MHRRVGLGRLDQLRESRSLGGRVDANDPQTAEIALLALASDVAVFERFLDRFLRGAIQLALGQEEAAG
jgi:hypothetical protein